MLSRLDARTWSGAFFIMFAVLAVLWGIEIVNIVVNYRLDDYGLKPRQLGGLEGVVTMPFLHGSVGHLLANSGPFLIIGWMALVGEVRNFLLSTLIIVIGGGLLTWVLGPSGTVVGASGLVFGWLGYLLARAFFARKILWIAGAAFLIFFFSGLLDGLLPSVDSGVAWQAHVCGFAAGIAAGWYLHPRKGSPRALKKSPALPI